jgi:hypothetical protein
MDALASRQHHARMRAPPHIKRVGDCFGDLLVRVVCECGACREITPQALARLVGWKVTAKRTRAADALLAVRQESCRGGGSGEPEARVRRSRLPSG